MRHRLRRVAPHLRRRPLAALCVTHDVGPRQHQRDGDDQQVVELEPREREEAQQQPGGRRAVEQPPEDRRVLLVDGALALLQGLEAPVGRARVGDLVPPAEAHEQAAGDVLRLFLLLFFLGVFYFVLVFGFGFGGRERE